jgi:hypothetical protein
VNKVGWTRDQKLVVTGVIVAVAIGASAFFIPEVRQFLHLEKSPETTHAAVSPTPTSATLQTTQPQSVEPPKQEQTTRPNKKTPGSQKTTTHVKGNSNVAGNNVTGDSNVTGNNNQTGATANAPNGIAISGGTVIQPTVNNYTPLNRRLSDEQKSALKSCLAVKTGTFTVSALANNGEAYQYAQDFSDVFSGAGWKNEQPIPVAIIMIAGGMWSGVRISVHGTWDDATKTASLSDGTPETVGLNCLRAANFPATAIPWSDMKTGSIRVDVSERPQ